MQLTGPLRPAERRNFFGAALLQYLAGNDEGDAGDKGHQDHRARCQ
jgi:hypothetical protein